MAAIGPSSTYRLQIRPRSTCTRRPTLCDYLATLGVGAVYCSPLLPSARGSDHGYDVIAFDTIDPAARRRRTAGRAAGGRPAARPRARRRHRAQPHGRRRRRRRTRPGGTCCGSAANRRSPRWFDIDWATGRVLLPVLGDDFDRRQLRGRRATSCATSSTASRSRPAPGDRRCAATVHDRQHYELVNFRRADTEQNYRRFFAVTTLAGLRVEDEAVFDGHPRARSCAGCARTASTACGSTTRTAWPTRSATSTGCARWPARTPGSPSRRSSSRARRCRRLAGRRHDRLRRADRGQRPVRRPGRRGGVRPRSTASSPATDARFADHVATRQAHGGRRPSCGPRSAGWPGWCPTSRTPSGAGRAAGRLPGVPLLPAARGRTPRRGDRDGPGRRPDLADAVGALAPAGRSGRRAVRPVPADLRRGDGQGRRGHRLLPLHPVHRAERGRRRPGAASAAASSDFHAAQLRRQANWPARHDDAVDARHQAGRGRPGPAGRARRAARRVGARWRPTCCGWRPLPDPRVRLPALADLRRRRLHRTRADARLRREGHARGGGRRPAGSTRTPTFEADGARARSTPPTTDPTVRDAARGA